MIDGKGIVLCSSATFLHPKLVPGLAINQTKRCIFPGYFPPKNTYMEFQRVFLLKNEHIGLNFKTLVSIER